MEDTVHPHPLCVCVHIAPFPFFGQVWEVGGGYNIDRRLWAIIIR
jgi:hypothetical protein